MNVNYGYTLFVAHRYDEAAQQFLKSIEMDPNAHTGHWKYSVLLAVRGQWAEAVEQYRLAAKLEGNPNLPSAPATPQGFAQLVHEQVTFLSRQGQVGEILWAGQYAAEGDRENTITWLQKAAANHDSGFPFEVRNPLFDLVRSDPRYIEMMHSVGLPQ
ncbi:MAG TPA: hypothetical protein VKB58_07665 [Terriglobales bacterium]|jgi:tetratricopeptide (TPR) repeat protein|nr:hypothetical protein [Terriglobales bacterium]